ncbi:hypothetical protein LOTGIDRAFT_167388 [Lottia gigantea]|uniref:Uncharacterized protein n=1 Tax=Lottia gigantea TaxID=225164 RepID=V3ZU94_LOTGI|nr:hypothetical protein LOTGIDRAFT_167388 [Lottia gigantea]ESO86155.1 hypothetical protein LOTGIDRAFT_167388 [Lottia gigantea]
MAERDWGRGMSPASSFTSLPGSNRSDSPMSPRGSPALSRMSNSSSENRNGKGIQVTIQNLQQAVVGRAVFFSEYSAHTLSNCVADGNLTYCCLSKMIFLKKRSTPSSGKFFIEYLFENMVALDF